MTLSPEIKRELEQRAKLTRDLHERLRLCVVLARSEGMSQESIAQAHRISLQSIYRYLSEYESDTKTQHDPRGGSKSKLDKLQSKALLDHLQKTTYFHVKGIGSWQWTPSFSGHLSMRDGQPLDDIHFRHPVAPPCCFHKN